MSLDWGSFKFWYHSQFFAVLLNLSVDFTTWTQYNKCFRVTAVQWRGESWHFHEIYTIFARRTVLHPISFNCTGIILSTRGIRAAITCICAPSVTSICCHGFGNSSKCFTQCNNIQSINIFYIYIARSIYTRRVILCRISTPLRRIINR